MSTHTTRKPVAKRWAGIAAGAALALGSATALAADQSPYYPPGGFDPSNAYPSGTATTVYPVMVYRTAPVAAVPGQPIAAYPVTVYQTAPVNSVPGQPVTAYPVTVYQTAPANGAPVYYTPTSYPAGHYPGWAQESTTYPPSVKKEDALMQMKVAQEHAVRAVGAPDLATVQANLQATVNCLAGPNSGAYYPSAPNPCAGMGAGAIADTNDTARLPYEREALAHARSGLQTSDLGAAKQAAINTINTLRQASM
jgi:hypothetical protein